MKTRRILPDILAAAILLISYSVCVSQETVVLLPGQSSITINGTSSLHNWEEKVEKFDVNLNLTFREKEISAIDMVSLTCKSVSITSDNSIMTRKTHNALQVEKYPEIVFKLVSVDHLTSKNGSFSGTLVGDIILAGVTKRIQLTFAGTHAGNKITIKGSKELNMNDFKIKPPTAMMGTLKTGEQITVSFQLNFQVS
ncbi:MAG: YceI family protein [Bacteroidales bacterium]|nr:YceI family protein [Bacteroidales bacterium]